MGTNAGASASDFERVRKADNPMNEAGSIIVERAGEAADEIGKTASSAMQTAGSAMTRARDKGGETVAQAADVVGNFRKALETSARSQPGTTVAMAVAAGFIFGLLWRSNRSSN